MKSFIDSKCPKCSTQQKETIGTSGQEWAYTVRKERKMGILDKKFKVSQIIETIKLKDDDFRKRRIHLITIRDAHIGSVQDDPIEEI